MVQQLQSTNYVVVSTYCIRCLFVFITIYCIKVSEKKPLFNDLSSFQRVVGS